jgi:hypothetical protein
MNIEECRNYGFIKFQRSVTMDNLAWSSVLSRHGGRQAQADGLTALKDAPHAAHAVAELGRPVGRQVDCRTA